MSAKLNKRNKSEAKKFISKIQDNTIKVVFFDPQYRGVMDKLKYGNEGERQKGRADLPQMDDNEIKEIISQIERILTKSGHLFLWIDKYHLCEGINNWISGTSLNKVDLITWDKGKIGMGYRTRRKSEYLYVLQKSPTKAKGLWKVHDIPDVWVEKVSKDHPHCKPIELQKSLINATTEIGDIVVDPAAGSFSVMTSATSIGRNFLGCDING